MQVPSCTLLLFMVTSGCIADDEPGDPDRSFTVPSDTVYQQRKLETPLSNDNHASAEPVQVDLAACRYERGYHAHPLGAARILTHPVDSDRCEVWLVAEGDAPRYEAPPVQYCLLPRHGSVSVSRTSPAIASPRCVPLVAKVPDRASFDAALAAAPVVTHAQTSIALDIEIEACALANHTLGDASAIVRPSSDPATPSACEVFLATAAGPGMYCGFTRSTDDVSSVTAVLETDRLVIDSPNCFQPAY